MTVWTGSTVETTGTLFADTCPAKVITGAIFGTEHDKSDR